MKIENVKEKPVPEFKPFKLVIETPEEAISLLCHLGVSDDKVIENEKENSSHFKDFDIEAIVEAEGGKMWDFVSERIKNLKEEE